jgi:predicted XRE-type DNA-binding protein
MSQKIDETTITVGSGNVFADMGMPDAGTELVKAQLTRQLSKQIKLLGLTQTAAAARLGVSQPDVSRLMKNRPTGFSTDRLLGLLNALDLDVDIVVRAVEPGTQVAGVRVVESVA